MSFGGRPARGKEIESTPARAKDRALRLLSVRSRSHAELFRRLRMAGFDEQDIEDGLADLEAVGLIDDERFARELAAHEVDRRLAGRRAALASLRKAGVSRDVAERAVEEASGEGEEARAEELARSRLGRLRGLPPEAAYRRLLSFLQRRGYSGETARTACRRVMELDEG
ncbi:MAG: regulatory protein RecX [Actinomycetota bacterium]